MHTTAPERGTAAPRPGRITPNLFAISFGFAGLAQTWTVAARHASAPVSVAAGLWLVAGSVWVITLVLYARSVVASKGLHTELADHTFGPFLSVPTIVGMLLAGGLEPYARVPAVLLYLGSIGTALAIAARLLAIWALDESPATQWHPGYYLPGVGAPMVASGVAANFGYFGLARILFGSGIISWVLIGGILLHHLVGKQRLATPLLPTMAILIAPPIVAGNAWFAINGGRVDGIAFGLAGYALLMATVQLGLIPVYRTVAFGPGWWSYSFPFAAATTNAILWLSVEQATQRDIWTYLLLAIITTFIGYLAVRTLSRIAHHNFLAPPGPTIDPGTGQ